MKNKDAWFYCAEAVVSVAMRIQSMGYEIHGHDVRVKLCLCSHKPAAIDVELLRRILYEVTKPLSHRPLWDIIGRRDALIEDLLVLIRDRVSERLSGVGDVSVCLVKGRTGEGVEVAVSSNYATRVGE